MRLRPPLFYERMTAMHHEYYYYDKKVRRTTWNDTFRDYLNFSMNNCFPYRVLAKLYGKNNVATGKSNLVDYYRYSSGLNLFPEVLQNA